MIRSSFDIAAIPGDGIGREVLPEGRRVLEAAAKRYGFGLRFTSFEWASCDWYLRHGRMMPADWQHQLAPMDALYFGAVGWPAAVPDEISMRGSLQAVRSGFDQCVHLRPVRLFEGVPCPLAGRRAGDIDFVVVCENGEAPDDPTPADPASPHPRGAGPSLVIDKPAARHQRADDVLKFAFDLAQSRERRHLTIATAPQGGRADGAARWSERAQAMAARYPEIVVDRQGIDMLCTRFVLQPTGFDVVVASNRFGDILSDLGPACTGTIGLAPSASLNPERRFPSLFEPVHGSGPDIHGRNIANPIAMIWSGALMLDFLGHGSGACRQAHDAILRAIEAVLVEGPHTPDLGGSASTTDVGRAVAERLMC